MAVMKTNIIGFAQALDAQERFGADTDQPEGARFIQMSDTMARALAAELRDVERERLEWLSGKVWTPAGAETPPVPVEGAEAPPERPQEPVATDPVTDVPPKDVVYAQRATRHHPPQKPGMPAKKGAGWVRQFKNEDY